MSSVAGTVDISEQPRILEEVGRLVANEDAGLQSLSVRLDQM